jgi:hypothetical protein
MSQNMDARPGETLRDPADISAVGIGAKLCLVIVAGVLFNFYPDKIGPIWSVTDPGFTPLLSPEFQIYLPWLNVWWSLIFGLNLAHLVLRRWTAATCWADIALRVLSAVLFGWLVLGEPFVAIPLASALAKIALAVACFVTLVEAGKQFDRLLDGTRTVALWKERDSPAR